jgi:hypothetical protein
MVLRIVIEGPSFKLSTSLETLEEERIVSNATVK